LGGGVGARTGAEQDFTDFSQLPAFFWGLFAFFSVAAGLAGFWPAFAKL
jgi:hypothetical protein